MEKWEYTTERFSYDEAGGDGSSMEEQLNHLGEQGWELVGFSGIINETDERYFQAVLKRPKQA